VNDGVLFPGIPYPGPSGTAASVKIRVDISQPIDQYMDLSYGGCSGSSTYVTLAAGLGGTGHNYTGTLFTDDAALSITQGTAPFTGSFRPQQALSTLNGLPVNNCYFRARNRDPNNWIWVNKLDVFTLPQ
jgi:hypothetical protein